MKKIFLFVFYFIAFFPLHGWKKHVTIMLNPGQDAQCAGREFTRGATLQCCDSLKKSIEETYSGVTVIIPAQQTQSENAAFANRLAVDLYVSIHFFEKKDGPLSLDLYYFCLNPETDRLAIQPQGLAFIPYNKAYLEQLPFTKKLITVFYDYLQKNESKTFNMHQLYGIPFKPLVGIKTPAIGIEMSLKKYTDWELFVTPLTHAFGLILHEIQYKKGN